MTMMQINGFYVECDIAVKEGRILSGWFEVPSLPHTRYTIEIDVGLLIGLETHDQKVQKAVDAGEICGHCGTSKDQFENCEIDGCQEIARLAAEAEATSIVEPTQAERDALNAELEAGGDPAGDHERAVAGEPGLDAQIGTTLEPADDPAAVAGGEQVLMPGGEVEAVTVEKPDP